MKSRISFFNPGIFKNMLRRFWPLWLVYFVSWLFTLPIITLIESLRDGIFIPSYIDGGLSGLVHSSIVSNCILAVLVAMAMFSFLYNSRSTGLIASMPVRREAVFTSAYLAGLVPIVSANLIVVILNFAASLSSGISLAVIFKANLILFASNSLLFIVFYGMAVFIAMLTSNLLALPVLYIIANFFFLGMEQIIRLIFKQFIYGYTFGLGSTLEFLCPPVYFFGKLHVFTDATFSYNVYNISTVTLSGFGCLIAYVAAALLLSAIALLIFRKHKMESSGDVIAVPALRPIFKYGVSACSALTLGLFLYVIIFAVLDICYTSALILIIGMLIGALVGYLVSEMLLKKSLHVFRGNWTGFIVIAICCVVFVLGCKFDVFGISKNLPDADDVSYVSCCSVNIDVNDEKQIEKIIELNKQIIDNHNKLSQGGSEDYNEISFEYVLKDGRSISRQYFDVDAESYKAYADVMNLPEYIKMAFTPSVEVKESNIDYASFSIDVYAGDGGTVEPQYLELTRAQAVDFYRNALMPDIESGAKKTVYDDNDYFAEPEYPFTVCVNMGFVETTEMPDGTAQESYDSLCIVIDPQCKNCIQWVNDNLNIDLTKLFTEK